MTLWSAANSFAGIVTTDDIDTDYLTEYDVAIIGAPIDHGATYKPGARFGPKHIRESDYLLAHGSRPEVTSQSDPFDGMNVIDAGDIDVPVGYMHEALANIQEGVTDLYKAGVSKVVVLGGDHSISHATISAAREALHPDSRLAVIHWDAHADTGQTHFGLKTHGTPMRWLIENEYVRAEDFYQLGLRGYWPEQATFDWMRDRGMRWWTMRDIREHGIRTVMNNIISAIIQSDVTHVWLSIDIDVCDPAFAPGTGTAEPGGMTSADLLDSVFHASWGLPLIGGEVVEVNPMSDRDGITGILGNRVVLEMLRGMKSEKAKT